MARSMRIQMNRMWGRTLWIGLSAWVGLAGFAACSSIDEAPSGGRIEHPLSPGPKAPSPLPALAPSASPFLAPSSSAPAATTPASSPAPAPSGNPRLTSADYFEQATGIELSLRDKAIMNDCPDRAWSKRVPKRRCTKHDQCGDGFCDRGRCAAVWTCDADYGQPCEADNHCGRQYLCNDGRCSSCTSATECERQPSLSSSVRCIADDTISGAHMCVGSISGGLSESRQEHIPLAPKP
jgi:hypothetical protein